ncbi:MAG: hypothetical protein QM820_63795 [Minicystis sp.]
MTAATAAIAPAPTSVAARVLDVWDETEALRTVRVALPPAWAEAHARPGQVVKLFAADQEGYFALASAPSSEGTADLLLKRGGRVADAAIVGAAPGSALDISAPFGKGFPVEEARGRHLLLFAAGSGIAPIRSVVQHVLRRRSDFDRVTLFYGQRRRGDFAYGREHLSWERGGVRVVLCPSAESEEWCGVRGRVQEVARSIGFGGAALQTSIAFVSGMKAMVEAVKATLAGAGVPPASVHLNF